MTVETYFSTQPEASGENARISNPHADAGGPQGTEKAPAEGPLPVSPVGLAISSPDPPERPSPGCPAGRSFPKAIRILHRRDFRRVYDNGLRRSSSLCTVFIRPNCLPLTRLGITTPRALGGAVVRNRIRRRLREVFRLNYRAIPSGWDLVANPRPASATVAFDLLTREFLRILPKEQPTLEQATANRREEGKASPSVSKRQAGRKRSR